MGSGPLESAASARPASFETPGRTPLSVVIVSWNTRELTLEALASFLPARDPQLEVIVVDNASSDGSADAIEASFPEVHVIRNDRNTGFAGGVNLGLRAARHRLILLLNPDTRVIGDVLARLVEYADAHPEAGILGPRILDENGALQASKFRFPSLLNQLLAATYLYQLFPRSRFFNRERMGGSTRHEAERVDAVSGCAFLVRRELLDRVGMLDEAFFMYSEEVDLCYRAAQAGFEVHYAPVGEIVHLGGASSRLTSLRSFLDYRRSLLRFFWKHHGPAATQATRVLLLLFLVVRLPFWSIRARTGPDRPEAAAQAALYRAGVRFLLRPLDEILSSAGTGARS
jgi:GT2 family glycosyltransferase